MITVSEPLRNGREYLCYVNRLGLGWQVLSFYDGYWREKTNGMGLKYEPDEFYELPVANNGSQL